MTATNESDPLGATAGGKPDGLTQLLRERERDVAALVDQVASALAAGPHSAPPAATRGLRRRLTRLDELRTALDGAAGVLAAWAAHGQWEEQFGADTWPRREGQLRDAIEQEADRGTREWRVRWLAAMEAGAVDEAERLCTAGFPLAPEAVWWPSRCLPLTQSLRWAVTDPELAAPHFRDLPEVFAEEDAPVAGRVALLTTAARVLARNADRVARDLLDHARLVSLTASLKDDRRLQSGVLATTAFVDRRLTHTADRPETSPAGPAAGAGELPWVERLRVPAATDLTCAVELLHWAAREPVEIPSGQPGPEPVHGPVANISALVAGLPDVAGLPERFAALVDHPPDELSVELAARLVQEGQGARAVQLLDHLSFGWEPALDLRVAEVRVSLARAEEDGPGLAAALADAGQRALWAGDAERAVAWYGEALELQPDDAALIRRSAGAMIQHASALPVEEAEPTLRSALGMFERAEELDRGPASAWSSTLRQHAHSVLGGFPRTYRPEHLWRAVQWSAAAALADPSDAESWSGLAQRLTAVGAYRVAYRVALHAHRLAPETSSAREVRIIAALNLWRPAEALEIFPIVTDPASASEIDRGWEDALRGMADRVAGDDAGAARQLWTALQHDDDILYRYWLAETLTISGDAKAADGAWRAVWRDADIASVVGLEASAWAALHQGLVDSADELATRLESVTHGLGGFVSGPLIRALVAVLRGRSEGYALLASALSWIDVARAVDDCGVFLRLTLQRATEARTRRATPTEAPDAQVAPYVDRVMELVRARREEIAASWTDGSGDDVGSGGALREIDWFVHLTSGLPLAPAVADAASELRRAMAHVDAALARPVDPVDPVAAAESDPSDVDATAEEEPAPASSDMDDAEGDARVVYVAVAPHWFSQYAGRELEHPLFRLALPAARAAAATSGAELGVRVRVRTEEDCGRNEVWLEVPDMPRQVIRVDRQAWYAPESWLPALSEEQRAAAEPDPDAGPGLLRLSPASTPRERLSSWSAEEVVARQAIAAHLTVVEGRQVRPA